jgi:hypothetical protein
MADNELATTNGNADMSIGPALNLKGLNLRQISFIGQSMAKSGMFPDVNDGPKALVKILAGQEIGVTPFQAMTNIHIIQGKATMSANLMAAKLKGSGKYDYKVKLSSESCTVTVFEIVAGGKKEEIGDFTFSMKDAERAGLVKPNSGWTKYPQSMLFARAVSQAVRLYAPDVFNGNIVYSPDEMGAEVDDQGDFVRVEVESEPVKTDDKPAPVDTEAVADLMARDEPAEEVAEDQKPAEKSSTTEHKKATKDEISRTLRDALDAINITTPEEKKAFSQEHIGKDRPTLYEDFSKLIVAAQEQLGEM